MSTVFTTRPCPQFINCPGTDYPIENYSAEDPDPIRYCATAFYTATPPIGWNPGCGNIPSYQAQATACSTISYQDAYLHAYQLAQQMVIATWTTQSCPPPALVCNTPQSCTVTCPDGTTNTFTVAAGVICDLNQAAADAAAASYACQQAQASQVCLSELPDFCCLGTSYNESIIASGAGVTQPPGTNFWELISGSLPAGLTFNGGHLFGTSATITGVPTQTVAETFTIQLTTASGIVAQKTYTVGPQSINWSGATPIYAALPNGTQGSPYLLLFVFPTALTGTVTWALTSGSLPPGLSLNTTTGLVTGTPTVPGTYAFTIKLIEI